MNNSLPTIAISLGAIFVGGCFPCLYTTRPGVSGEVIDAGSGARIAGAEVILQGPGYLPDDPGESAPSVVAKTNGDGRFTFAPRRQWGIYVVGYDFIVLFWRLSVKREGYEPECIEFHDNGPTDGRGENVGSVKLRRLTGTSP